MCLKFWGTARQLITIRQTIKRVAPTDARVLITGENGTGKELVARWMHELSKALLTGLSYRSKLCSQYRLNCLKANFSDIEKGAFTGAVRQRIGKFEQAHGGTLFLDEIGDMPPESQAKVLRVLQEQTLVRVGGTTPVRSG